MANDGLSIDPSSEIVAVNRAVAMNALGHYAAALSDLNWAIGEGTHWVNWREARVVALKGLGRSADADLAAIKTLKEELIP